MPVSAFWQGIAEFNQQEFYACHDTFEALWLEASELDKNFYQGILQIAVACYHMGNLNWNGAVILLGEGIKRLSEYQPLYYEIDVTHLISDSSKLLKSLQQITPEQISEFVENLQLSQEQQQYQSNFPTIIRVKEELT
jgi:hypothetical protein